MVNFRILWCNATFSFIQMLISPVLVSFRKCFDLIRCKFIGLFICRKVCNTVAQISSSAWLQFHAVKFGIRFTLAVLGCILCRHFIWGILPGCARGFFLVLFMKHISITNSAFKYWRLIFFWLCHGIITNFLARVWFAGSTIITNPAFKYCVLRRN